MASQCARWASVEFKGGGPLEGPGLRGDAIWSGAKWGLLWHDCTQSHTRVIGCHKSHDRVAECFFILAGNMIMVSGNLRVAEPYNWQFITLFSHIMNPIWILNLKTWDIQNLESFSFVQTQDRLVMPFRTCSSLGIQWLAIAITGLYPIDNPAIHAATNSRVMAKLFRLWHLCLKMLHVVSFCCILLISRAKILVPCVSSNISSQRIVPQWLLWNSFTSWTVYSGGLENSGPKISQTGHDRASSNSSLWRVMSSPTPRTPASCRGARRKASNCSSPTSESSCISHSICWCFGGRSLQGAIHLQWLPASWRSTQ